MARILRTTAALLFLLLLSSCATSQSSKELSVISYNLGNAYALQREDSAAEAAYRNAFSYDPENTEARFNLVILLVENQEYAKAEAELLPLLEKQPEDRELQKMRAYILYHRYLPEDALSVYEQLLSEEEDEQLRLRCARIAMDLKQYDRARDHLQSIYDQGLFSGELMFLFGEIEMLTGISDGMSWYKTAVLTEPEYLPALDALLAYAEGSESEGVEKELIRVLEEAVEASPDESSLQYLLGMRMLLAGDAGGIDHIKESIHSGYAEIEEIRGLLISLEDTDLAYAFAEMLEQEGLVYIYRTQAAP